MTGSKCITIYTDASVCPKTLTGGWACWIKRGPGESMKAAGAFKSGVKCSTVAELMAIINSLSIALKYRLPENLIIVVVTDSEQARHAIFGGMSKKWKRKRKDIYELANMVKRMIPEECELRVNKVKAHSRKDGARSWVNGTVDHLARSAMRKARPQEGVQA